jgi:hypothetical protein
VQHNGWGWTRSVAGEWQGRGKERKERRREARRGEERRGEERGAVHGPSILGRHKLHFDLSLSFFSLTLSLSLTYSLSLSSFMKAYC